MEKAVKTNNPKILDYNKIVSIGAENKAKRIYDSSYKNLLAKVDKICFNNYLLPKRKDKKFQYQKEAFDKILNQVEYYPNAINLTNDILDNMEDENLINELNIE